jgi:V8-like Glu-specific endopeptidase
MLSESTSCTAFHVGHNLFITASHCFAPDTSYLITDSEGEVHGVDPILIDRDRDVAVFESDGFSGPALALWNEKLYGSPHVGSTIVSMGFPGYYLQGFVFEEGTVLDYRKLNGTQMIISRGVSYPGESGGPVISLRTGQVVGLVHALAERITELDEDTKVHNTLSLLVAWSEIKIVLEQARKVR